MNWWRSQRVALIALGAAAAAAFLVHLWLDVLEAPTETTTVIQAVDDRAEITGQTLTLGAVAWDAFDAPAGTRTVSVRLSADAADGASTCGPLTLTEPGSGRVWLDARGDLDVPYDAGETSCLDDASLPYGILAVFLVPEGATGPFVLDVADEDDRVARFTIEP